MCRISIKFSGFFKAEKFEGNSWFFDNHSSMELTKEKGLEVFLYREKIVE